MASEVVICNMALAHLGQIPNVASINPSDGSPEADWCAMFYPVARDATLEKHTWGFATTRQALALIGSAYPEWQYAYAQPAGCLNILSILAEDATDDYSEGLTNSVTYPTYTNPQWGIYTPQQYSTERDAAGNQIIYTNQENAVCRYTQVVTDTGLFTPLFTTTLSFLLASFLAGPIMKGQEGQAESKRLMALWQYWLDVAQTSDSNQRKIQPTHEVAWLAGR